MISCGWKGTGLRILRSRFDAFGAGMPETSTPENPLRIGPDGWLEYTVNRRVPDLTIFVGRVAGHVLHIKGRAIPFTSLAEPGTALRFSVGTAVIVSDFGKAGAHGDGQGCGSAGGTQPARSPRAAPGR